MTYPTVVGVAHGTDVPPYGFGITVSLPNGCNVGGRILIVQVLKSGPAAPTWPVDYPWQVLDNYSGSGGHSDTRYLVLTGNELPAFPAIGATITLTGSSATYAAYSWLLSGAEEPECAASAGAGANADPPPLTPSTGLADYLWIVMGGWISAGVVSAYPSGYNSNQHTDSAGVGCTHARCSKLAHLATDNPGAFTVSDRVWRLVTIAVKGISGGGIVGATAQAYTFGRVVTGKVTRKGQVSQPFVFGRVTQGSKGSTGAGIIVSPFSFGSTVSGRLDVRGSVGTSLGEGAVPVAASRPAAGGLTYLFGDDPVVPAPPPPSGEASLPFIFLTTSIAALITQFAVPPVTAPRLRVYLGGNLNPSIHGYPFPAATSWVEITADVREVSWTRGRQLELDEIQAGGASLTLVNEERKYDPTNTAGQFYPLTIDRQIKIEAEYENTTYPLFWGYVAEWAVEWDAHQPGYSETQVELVDAISLLAGRDLSTYYNVPAGAESVSARIGRILTTLGFPAGMRELSGGGQVIKVQEVEGAWEHIQRCVQSNANLSVCRVDRRGWFVFSGKTASGATFGDDGVDELSYSRAGMRLNMDLVYTHATVTRHDTGDPESPLYVAPVPQTIGPTGTAGKRRVLTRSDTLNVDDNSARAVAQALFNQYSVVRARPEQVAIRPADRSEVWPHVLGMDVEHTFTLNRRPPGGGPVYSQLVTILSLTHHVAGLTGDWTATYSVAGSAV